MTINLTQSEVELLQIILRDVEARPTWHFIPSDFKGGNKHGISPWAAELQAAALLRKLDKPQQAESEEMIEILATASAYIDVFDKFGGSSI